MDLRMKGLFIIILLVAAGCSKTSHYPDGMWPLNIFGEFLGSHERILCYFDFNRDRYVDLVTISNDNALNIYLWSDWNNRFQVEATLETHGISILSVIPTNFTHNDRVDLLATF